MFKKLICMVLLAATLFACQPAGENLEPTVPITTEVATSEPPTSTPNPTDTPQSTETPTLTPTFTLTPTETQTRTPTPTALGGGSGLIRMFISVNLIELPMEDPTDFNLVISSDQIASEFNIASFSTSRTDYISPQGTLAAFWNCATEYCDTKRGNMYLFTTDFKKKASIDVAGFPNFLGLSADQDRLLYYLGSTMSDDYYLVKTKDPGFGELIPLGRMTHLTWAADGKTLYAQKGSTVYQLDKDGKELKTYECLFNNACALSPSPDGKRFAGIQKFVPTGSGNPVITISNQDFSDKKSIFLTDNDALILSIAWMPDNQHIIVFGQTARQRVRRFWRLDYLSIINVDLETERVIKLDIPEDSEWFGPCGLTPDGTHLVYLGAGGRVKEGGRILMSGRFAQIFPIEATDPEFERITLFNDSWESCPIWIP